MMRINGRDSKNKTEPKSTNDGSTMQIYNIQYIMYKEKKKEILYLNHMSLKKQSANIDVYSNYI